MNFLFFGTILIPLFYFSGLFWVLIADSALSKKRHIELFDLSPLVIGLYCTVATSHVCLFMVHFFAVEILTFILLMSSTLGFIFVLKTQREKLRVIAQQIAFLLAGYFFVSLPFAKHLAGPDIDSTLFGFFSAQMKNGWGFPLSSPWGPSFGHKIMVATDSFSQLSAAISSWFPIDLALAAIVNLSLWTVAILGCGYALVDRMFPKLSVLTKTLCLIGIYNSAFLWEGGDGSYNRVPGTACLFLLVFYWCTRLRERPPLWFYNVGSVLLGFCAYFHLRLFIWFVPVFVILFLKDFISQRLSQTSLWGRVRLVFLPAVLQFVILSPLLYNFVILPEHIDSQGVSASVAAKLNLSYVKMLASMVRFQGVEGLVLLLSLTAFYFIKPLREWIQQRWILNQVFIICIIHLAVQALFFIEGLLPFLPLMIRSVIYPQMVSLYNFSLVKWGALTLLIGFIVSQEKPLPKITPWLALGVSGYLVYHLFELRLFLFKISQTFLTNHSSHLVYGVLFLLLGVLFCVASVRTEKYRLEAVLLCLVALQLSRGIYNHPYLSLDQKQAMNWLKQETPVTGTLVLAHSTLDLASDIEQASHPKELSERGRLSVGDISSLWLPAISERPTVFHRGNFLERFTGKSFLNIPNAESSQPNFEALDKAYWNPDWPDSCKAFQRSGVTHIYAPGKVRKVVDFEKSSCLKIAYESARSHNYITSPPEAESQKAAAIFAVQSQLPGFGTSNP